MKLNLTIGGARWEIDTARRREISIPLSFDGEQPNHFDAPPARMSPLRMGDFVGDTRQGGGCNVQHISLVPHCNGTHTECIGHIVGDGPPVGEALPGLLIPAVLVSVTPEAAGNTGEDYDPPKAPEDRLITAAALRQKLGGAAAGFREGLIVRTLPNDPAKRTRHYGKTPPPYFSLDAVRFLNETGVRHLLVDIPSIDRMYDEGRLQAHHLFWNVPPGEHRLFPESLPEKTVTEMIYVDADIPDGPWLINIQIPAFVTDAAPSRVWIFPPQRVDIP